MKVRVRRVFGFILASFQLKFQGSYTSEILSRKSAQKNPKIERALLSKHSLRALLFFLYVCFAGNHFIHADLPEEKWQGLPSSYQGRFRPMAVSAGLQFYRFSHQYTFQTESPLHLLWKLHFLGHQPWKNSPLFWVHYAELKKILQLNPHLDHFSYDELQAKLFENKETFRNLMEVVLPYFFFSNEERKNRKELTQLAKGLWVSLEGNRLRVMEAPKNPPWHFLKSGDSFPASPASLSKKNMIDEWLSLLEALRQFERIVPLSKIELDYRHYLSQLRSKNFSPEMVEAELEELFSLRDRLKESGTLFIVLPGRFLPGEWFSLKALKIENYRAENDRLELVKNFTLYSDDLFEKIQNTYLQLETAVLLSDAGKEKVLGEELAEALKIGYTSLAGKPYLHTHQHSLTYPSWQQLRAELYYYRYPWIILCLGLYGSALLFFILHFILKKPLIQFCALCFLITAFSLHTFLLLWRSYILGRPPVSNMFETLLYVPWVAVGASFVLRYFLKNTLIFIVSSLAGLTLLILLQIARLDSSMENVQAVLNSRYWLIVHVLMVVGSYGIFFLSGIMGHLYLFCYAFKLRETASMQQMAKFILQAMYLGVALLIPGTLLGGVWAAESWGRFWDWDPKESWAFISACVYLLWIHAYRFRYLQNFGLAVGSMVGLQAIIFTWYGVNYILGTGLHSYGFGSGGEHFYYLGLAFEAVFLAFVILKILKGKKHEKVRDL